MAAETYVVTLTCDREGCENNAVVVVAALGCDDPNMLCAACVTKFGQRLEAAENDYTALINHGVDQRLAQRIVGARLDRKEI